MEKVATYVINYSVNQKFLSIQFEQNNFLSIQVQKHSSALIENQWPYRRSARQDSNCLFTTFLQLICCSSKKVQGSRFLLHVCVKCFFFAALLLYVEMKNWSDWGNAWRYTESVSHTTSL